MCPTWCTGDLEQSGRTQGAHACWGAAGFPLHTKNATEAGKQSGFSPFSAQPWGPGSPEPADASPLRPATQVSANSCSLLAELLAGLAAEAPGSVRDDPLVTDLTQRVMAARGRLEALVSRLMEPGASSSWAGDGSAAAAGLEGLLAAALERHMVAAEVLSRWVARQPGQGRAP